MIVLVAVAALQLLPIYLGSHPSSGTPPPKNGTLVDLCAPANGSNCKGYQFQLPATINSRLANATGCDPFSSWGTGETLWLNYSADENVYAIVLPSAIFGGVAGWSIGAYAIVANTSAVQSALWFANDLSGQFTEAIHVPSHGGSYCIGWWEPLASPANIQFLSDVTATYQ